MLLLACPATAGTYKLYYLGGQSNMHGHGWVRELPKKNAVRSERTLIYAGNPALDDAADGGLGLWAPLEPGFGLGFRSDGEKNELGEKFGPELGFGQAMEQLVPDTPVAIVKYALGGTGLAMGVGYGDWHPDYSERGGINQYDHALQTIRDALSHTDIDGDGEADTLIPAGIVWMQGEADANDSIAVAEAYQANLERMMNLLRATMRVDNLPVVIGRITDSGMADDGSVMDNIRIVQRAQAAFVEADECATYVTITDELTYPPNDAWHYTTDGFLRLGEAFAEAALKLEADCRGSNEAMARD